MSVTNAISSVIIVGAIVRVYQEILIMFLILQVYLVLAIALAAINILEDFL